MHIFLLVFSFMFWVIRPSKSLMLAYAPILRELERSVDRYAALRSREEVAAYLRTLATQRRDEAVFVLGNRLFAFRKFLGASKNRRHAGHVLSTLQTKTVANVAYAFVKDSTGNATDAAFPFAAISKKRGYGAAGILVPNPFFADPSGNLSWWERRKEVRRATTATGQARAQTPYGDRRVFWRGNLGHHEDDCERDEGNFARFDAIALTLEHAGEFDVKCNKCVPNNRSCHGPYDAAMRHLVDVNFAPCYDQKWYDPFRDYPTYRALLNLPGTTAGGYSRNLNVLWLLGRVVFFWEAPFVEFYWPALVPGLTHLVVNRTTALRAYRSLDDVSSEGGGTVEATLVRGARLVAEHLVCGECLRRFFVDFFLALRRRFRLGLILDTTRSNDDDGNVERLAAIFDSAGVDCARDFLEIVAAPSASHKKSGGARLVETPVVAFSADEKPNCLGVFRSISLT